MDDMYIGMRAGGQTEMATSPGGNTTNVQVNIAGAFYGDDSFTYSSTTHAVSVAGTLNILGSASFAVTAKAKWDSGAFIDDLGGFANQIRISASNGVTVSNQLNVGGNLVINAASKTLSLVSGTNACIGSGTLSSGATSIATTAVASGSKIFLQDTSAGVVNVGTLTVSSSTPGTGFSVKSTNVSDSGTFDWIIIQTT